MHFTVQIKRNQDEHSTLVGRELIGCSATKQIYLIFTPSQEKLGPKEKTVKVLVKEASLTRPIRTCTLY